MKNLNIFFEDYEFSEMLKLKAKLGITWKEVVARGLKGGKDGKNRINAINKKPCASGGGDSYC